MNLMVGVKSILAGVLAVVLGVPTIAVTLIIGVGIFYRPNRTSNAVSWDSRSLIGTWPFNWVFWLPIAFLFAIGFFWELRRASH
jgi:phosphate/sulfate permease